MATANTFDLLGDNDAEDPSLVIAAKQPKSEPKKAAAATRGKLPFKPLPPAQAVKEARSNSARGGRGAGGGSYRDSRDLPQNENPYVTLKEYEKVLQAIKTEGRKVDAKELESMAMQALSNKKSYDKFFIKLGSEKDKKKELAEKEERARKGLGELTIDVGGLDVKQAMKYLKSHIMIGVLLPTLSSIRVIDGSGCHDDDKLKSAIMDRLQKAGIPFSKEDPKMVIDGQMDFSILESDSDSD